jgi:hypothetical protein
MMPLLPFKQIEASDTGYSALEPMAFTVVSIMVFFLAVMVLVMLIALVYAFWRGDQ